VAMSINLLALVGVLRPSLLTRSRHVVSARNAPMTSESMMLGSSVRWIENRRMYSHRDSPGCWRQLWRSHEFPGRTYIPWKFPAKALTRSSQSEIYAGGRCSSPARAVSERKRGRLRMMSVGTMLRRRRSCRKKQLRLKLSARDDRRLLFMKLRNCKPT
jgi:hypothetical protein